MTLAVVRDECCEACLSGDHFDHRLSQVFDYQGLHIGDHVKCRCRHNRRKLPSRIVTQVVVLAGLATFLGAAFQVGLWFVLFG